MKPHSCICGSEAYVEFFQSSYECENYVRVICSNWMCRKNLTIKVEDPIIESDNDWDEIISSRAINLWDKTIKGMKEQKAKETGSSWNRHASFLEEERKDDTTCH